MGAEASPQSDPKNQSKSTSKWELCPVSDKGNAANTPDMAGKAGSPWQVPAPRQMMSPVLCCVLYPSWLSLRRPVNNLQEGQQWLINGLISQSQEGHLHQEGIGNMKTKAFLYFFLLSHVFVNE